MKGLQQYTKELVSRGYGYYIDGLCLLNKEELDSLLENELKVMPGHKSKFNTLLKELKRDMEFKDKNFNRQYLDPADRAIKNPTASNKISKKTQNLDTNKENFSQNRNKQKSSRIKEMGIDYFLDSADISREQSELIDEIFQGFGNSSSNNVSNNHYYSNSGTNVRGNAIIGAKNPYNANPKENLANSARQRAMPANRPSKTAPNTNFDGNEKLGGTARGNKFENRNTSGPYGQGNPKNQYNVKNKTFYGPTGTAQLDYDLGGIPQNNYL